MNRVAIVSAMHEELAALLPALQGAQTQQHAGRAFHLGRLGAQEVVLVLSGIGKVAAACTATLLIERYGVSRIIFTGVAGGLGDGVAVGDVVLADALLQHDLDASPIFPRHEVPLTGLKRFAADPVLTASVYEACARVLNAPHALLGAQATELGVTAPRLHRGLIVSGDQFISTTAQSGALRSELPDALAVEMEGAAMAQVCHAFGVLLAVMRVISDRADDNAHRDFSRFIEEVARRMTATVVMAWAEAADAKIAVTNASSETCMSEISVPLSFGELLDKIAILQIKSERMSDAAKLANVRKELDALNATWATHPASKVNIADLRAELKKINETLWVVEDDIRLKEKAQAFDAEFIRLARAVYVTNDERARVKKDINLKLGSAYVEEKSYEDYKAS